MTSHVQMVALTSLHHGFGLPSTGPTRAQQQAEPFDRLPRPRCLALKGG
jgi:hypothetical protein